MVFDLIAFRRSSCLLLRWPEPTCVFRLSKSSSLSPRGGNSMLCRLQCGDSCSSSRYIFFSSHVGKSWQFLQSFVQITVIWKLNPQIVHQNSCFLNWLSHLKIGIGTEMAQLVCGGCHTLLMYIRGATSVRCSCCHTVNLAHEGEKIAVTKICVNH